MKNRLAGDTLKQRSGLSYFSQFLHTAHPLGDVSAMTDLPARYHHLSIQLPKLPNLSSVSKPHCPIFLKPTDISYPTIMFKSLNSVTIYVQIHCINVKNCPDLI